MHKNGIYTARCSMALSFLTALVISLHCLVQPPAANANDPAPAILSLSQNGSAIYTVEFIGCSPTLSGDTLCEYAVTAPEEGQLCGDVSHSIYSFSYCTVPNPLRFLGCQDGRCEDRTLDPEPSTNVSGIKVEEQIKCGRTVRVGFLFEGTVASGTYRNTMITLKTGKFGLLQGMIAGPDCAARREKSFFARLDGYQEVPAVSTLGRGRFQARLNSNAEGLEFSLAYEGLEGSSVNFARVHFGRPATNGGVIVWLCDNTGTGPTGTQMCPDDGEVVGILQATDVVGPLEQGITPGEFEEMIEAMCSGSTHVNVHTLDFPEGEIRGQILVGRQAKVRGKD